MTAAPITVAAVAGTKVYDGTTYSTAMPTVTSGSLAAGDTATWTKTFDTRNAGAGKTLTAAGSINDGNGGGNYAVTFAANTTGSVTARSDHCRRGYRHEGLRRHNLLDRHADDHLGQPGQRRHGGLYRNFQHRNAGRARRSRWPVRSTTATTAPTTR